MTSAHLRKTWLDNERYDIRWLENFIFLLCMQLLFHWFMK
ncbi:hypothetical protein V462_15440 [Pantoea ananatis 15320]|nr:hypothetical protein L585_07810 [Pantoea ananatis BRT175]PKC33687.1 hypothetical protein V462_15440 [Pantoea ananatis 15320]PKC46144.1 hypothetical protein V461_05295 [Pantoea ananatis BRT98]